MGAPTGSSDAATTIEAKRRALADHGFDIGSPTAGVEAAGSGGFVRRFARAHIYWHPSTGAHEVHGNVLTRYLALGGPGANPATGRRDFGYPMADETTGHLRTPLSKFEFGTVYAVPGGAAGVWGRLDDALQPDESGFPLTEPVRADGLEVLFCQRGYLVADDRFPTVMPFSVRTPMLGRPALLQATSTTLPDGIDLHFRVLPGGAVRPEDLDVAELAQRMARPWRNRLALRPIGSSELVPLTVEVTRAVKTLTDSPGPGEMARLDLRLSIRLAANATIAERTLHDLVFHAGGTNIRTVAAHCVYLRSSWDRFGIIHATDLHVSARVDGFRQALRATGSQPRERSARQMVNPNDSVRSLINYANQLHARGEVDIILATGDLVDYVYEDNQPKGGPGNFGLLERLVLGRAPGQDPESPPSNELRVPLFTVLGNHDYVTNPYKLYFKIDIPLHEDRVVRKYAAFNLGVDDAIAIEGGTRPTVSTGAASTMAESSETSARYYLDRINDRLSYVVPAGPKNRIAMLDTGSNRDIIAGFWDAFMDVLGQSNEDEENFKRGLPTTKGVSEEALELLRREIADAPDDGVFVVGLHTPPLNPYDSEYPHYFRESERTRLDPEKLRRLVLSFISRVTSQFLGGTRENPTLPDNVHKTIVRTPEPHFARGALDDLLDFGIGRARANELLSLLSRGNVDVVLAGHVHEQVEFRLRGDRYFSDYYTETPKEARVSYDWFIGGDLRFPNVVGDKRPIHIVVRDGASVGAAVGEIREPHHSATMVFRRLEVPPYPDPLSKTTNREAWWRKHRPLVLLTSCVGPIDHQQRDQLIDASTISRPHVRLQGIRMLRVDGPTIKSINWIGTDEIRADQAVGPIQPEHHPV